MKLEIHGIDREPAASESVVPRTEDWSLIYGPLINFAMLFKQDKGGSVESSNRLKATYPL